MDPKMNQASGAIFDVCKNYIPVARIPCWSSKLMDPKLNQANGAIVDV
jgi:hypothetical protein